MKGVLLLGVLALAGSQVHEKVLAHALFADPAQFYGKEIEFVGFFSARSKTSRWLWLGREDFRSGDPGRCIEVQGEIPEFRRLTGLKWNLTYIQIRGRFSLDLDQQAYCRVGVLSDIVMFESNPGNLEMLWEVSEEQREAIFAGDDAESK